MPIDTSSYYPETPRPEGEENYSLNSRNTGLFGDRKEATEAPLVATEGTPPQPAAPEPQEPRSTAVKIADLCANILSWLMVPLMMPVYGLLLIFGLTILTLAPGLMKLSFIGVVAGINLIMPILLFVLLKRLGFIDDLGLNGRKERLIPYIITIVGYLLTAWFMTGKGAPLWMSLFFYGGAVAAAINLVINMWWKISAHAAGVAGLIALLLHISHQGMVSPQIFIWLILSIAVAGLLGTARVWLERHTVWQVLAGYTVGFCSVFFLMTIG